MLSNAHRTPPTSPIHLGQPADGAPLEGEQGNRGDTGRLGRGRRNSSQEPYRGLRRGVSAAMLKTGDAMPSPGLFERGPQTPDYQQVSPGKPSRCAACTL